MTTPDFKILILSRYCGEFRQADEDSATDRKTSEDIVMDLRPMADFSTNEISEYMTMNNYSIGFDGDTPVWLLQKTGRKELPQ